MTDESSAVLRFADCELDLASRELRRDGDVVSLEPRAFALLAYLADQRHRAVDKDDIQEAVWAGVIVSETALTRAIMKARRAVGDSASEQSVIRTVHGHGYQFVAPLVAVAGVQDETVGPAGDATPSFPWPRALAAAVAVFLVAFAMWSWRAGQSVDATRLAILPVENATDDAELNWARLGLMGLANELMAKLAVVDVLPPSDVVRYTERAGWSDSIDRNDIATDQKKLRQLYGSSHLLLTRLEKNTGGLRLTYALHAPDGRIDSGTMVGNEPSRLMEGLIQSIARQFSGRGASPSDISVVSDDPYINEAYSRGLSFALEGRCAEALPHFNVALANIDEPTQAQFEAANCERILGQWESAQARFLALIEQLKDAGPSRLRTSAYTGLGNAYVRTGRGDEALVQFDRALLEAQATGDPLSRGRVLNAMAIEVKNRREFGKARDLLARATLAYREAGVEILPGQLPAALANLDMAQGKLDQADTHLQQALDAFRTLGDRRNEAMMLNNTGYLRRLQGRYVEAEPLHEQSLAIRREIGDRVGQGRILGMLSTLYMHNGRADDARAAAIEALAIAREANDSLYIGTGLAQLASIELRTGDLTAARAAYVEADEVFDSINDYSRVAQVSLRLARLDLREGDVDGAAGRTDLVLALAQQEALFEPWVEALDTAGDVAHERGDTAQAITHYRNALAKADETGFVADKTKITVKLVNLLLEGAELVAIEPLMGFLIEQEPTVDNLLAQAGFAFAKGDAERAAALADEARNVAGTRWTDSHEQIRLRYVAATPAGAAT